MMGDNRLRRLATTSPVETKRWGDGGGKGVKCLLETMVGGSGEGGTLPTNLSNQTHTNVSGKIFPDVTDDAIITIIIIITKHRRNVMFFFFYEFIFFFIIIIIIILEF